MTPFYNAHGITIYCGDSRDIAPRLGFQGLVLTDPPYGISHPTDFRARGRSGNVGGEMRFRGFGGDYPPVHGDDEPLDPSALLTLGDARIIWGGNHFASRLPDSGGWLVWDKERPDDLDQSTCELAWSDVVKGVRIWHHLWNGMCRASESGKGQFVHPTQKPIALMEWCMSLRWTKHFQDILDPYMGGGSTLLAALRQGKRATGIEISPDYCQVAADRIEREVVRLGKVTAIDAKPGQQLGLLG